MLSSKFNDLDSDFNALKIQTHNVGIPIDAQEKARAWVTQEIIVAERLAAINRAQKAADVIRTDSSRAITDRVPLKNNDIQEFAATYSNSQSRDEAIDVCKSVCADVTQNTHKQSITNTLKEVLELGDRIAEVVAANNGGSCNGGIRNGAARTAQTEEAVIKNALTLSFVPGPSLRKKYLSKPVQIARALDFNLPVNFNRPEKPHILVCFS
jgi:hypothetical protein